MVTLTFHISNWTCYCGSEDYFMVESGVHMDREGKNVFSGKILKNVISLNEDTTDFHTFDFEMCTPHSSSA